MTSHKTEMPLIAEWNLEADAIDTVTATMLIREAKRLLKSEEVSQDAILGKLTDIIKFTSSEKANEALEWLFSDDNDQGNSHVFMYEPHDGRHKKYDVIFWLSDYDFPVVVNIADSIFEALESISDCKDDMESDKRSMSAALRELADKIDAFDGCD